MSRLSKYETVERCLRLCNPSRHGRHEPVTTDGTYFTSVHTSHPVSSRMDYVDNGRYGELKAPSSLLRDIRATTHRLMDVLACDPSIESIVICGFHEHAVLAYYVASCIQTLVACQNWQKCSYPGVLCVTFGLPKYWHASPSAFEHWKVVMLDDWYVLSPFTINLRASPNTFWIGDVSHIAYVCHTLMSLFACVHSTRDIVHYAHEWSRCKHGLAQACICNEEDSFDILVDPSSPTL